MTSGFGNPDVVDHAHVGMIKRRGGARFLFETMYAARISREFTRNQFQRDLATEVCVVCEIDLAHSARTERTQNLKASDFCPGQKFARFVGEHSGGKFICGRTEKVIIACGCGK